MREYKSFDEVDRDLKILRLQTLIDKEEMKISYGQTRHNLSPRALGRSLISSLARKAIVAKALSKFLWLKYIISK